MPVVDTSLVLAVLLDEPNSVAARTFLATDQPLHAPDHLPLEAANALTTAVRRERINVAGATSRLQAVLDLPLIYHPHRPLLPRALDIALRHQRRPFDAVFVALAEHLEDQLVTCDGVLVRGMMGTSLGKWVKMLTY